MEKGNIKNKLLIAILLIIIIAIAGGGYYYLKSTSPKNIIVNQICDTLEKAGSNNTLNSNKFNTSVTLSGNIETTNNDVKDIAKILNEGKITINVQSDLDTKKTLVGADLDYQNEKLLQAKAYYQIGDENVYFYVQDLFDKYFKVDVSDSSDTIDMGETLNTNRANVDSIFYKKAQKIIKDTISKNLKDEYFTKEDADDMTKNTMKISVAELRTAGINILTSLKTNEDFLNCYENPEDLKAEYDGLIKSIQDYKKDKDSAELEISLYTKGFSSEIIKVDSKITISESEESKFSISKKDDNNFDYLVEVKGETKGTSYTAEALKGTIKIEKKDNETKVATIVIDNVPDVGKVTLNLEVKNSNTTDFENIDVSNSVEIEKMTQNELIKLYTNLTNMKIYPLIAPYLGL